MKKLIEDLHQELTDGKSFDLIAALKKVIHFAGNKFAGANPAFEEDIRKSAPNIFLEIQNLDDKLREVVRLILKYGVDNGLIRKDISLRVAVELIMNISINLLVNSNNGYHAFFSESEIYDTTTKIILNGLLTDKGKSIMNSMDNNSIKGTNTITTDPHHFDDK
jgi:hypothetical protein